jgi:Uma2 family endonuclease
MSISTQKRATLDDLYRTEGKVELVGGRIVHDVAFADNMGFAVPELPSGRESFSPDASYYLGTLPANLMRFVEGPPTFAVEVRSENDYGAAAEAEMAAKRTDYFLAGTPVVWDVDPVAELVHVYRSTDPDRATTYGRGQDAEAEPAMPGWRLAVDAIFGAPGRA